MMTTKMKTIFAITALVAAMGMATPAKAGNVDVHFAYVPNVLYAKPVVSSPKVVYYKPVHTHYNMWGQPVYYVKSGKNWKDNGHHYGQSKNKHKYREHCDHNHHR